MLDRDMPPYDFYSFCLVSILTLIHAVSPSLSLSYVTKAKPFRLEKLSISMEILDCNYPIPGFNYPFYLYFVFVIYRGTSRVS